VYCSLALYLILVVCSVSERVFRVCIYVCVCVCVCRPVLENFSHLSERDHSVLHKFPLDKVGSLLHGEESHCAAASLEHLLRGQPHAVAGGRSSQARGEVSAEFQQQQKKKAGNVRVKVQ